MKKALRGISLLGSLAATSIANQAWALTLPGGGAAHQGSINELLNYILYNVIYPILSVFALGALVWGGLTLIMSGGDEAKVKKGRTILTSAVIGILLIFLSYAIIIMLGDFLSKTVK